ncbi:F-box protein At3g07870-like [Rutidosis leptorrhynchoides]|uniref:F-box protein At3g07870-like n=1 Tax=Rutidosis leptorrhynchoides TaxID=125765 RepID=UPI003A9A1811
MTDLIPFDIQTEITKKLPIISLIRFRSVSKPWKSLIDSSKFIIDNCLRDNQPHHLFVSYNLDSVPKYVSIIDDDSFPQHKFSLTIPVSLNQLPKMFKLGSSQGIICFYNFSETVVLWNITIRKSVSIPIPNVLYKPHGYTVFGFGVHPNTSDPKLVKITHIKSSGTDTIDYASWDVEVFTLSSGDWRSISISMPLKPVELSWSQVFINGVIYWHGNDAGHENGHNRLISFDLKSEEFGEVLLSDSLVRSTAHVYLKKMTGSLVVIEGYYEPGDSVSVVWKMNEEGVLKSFTKLFTVKASGFAIMNSVLEFRKNGEPIMESVGQDGELTILEVYEPSSGRVKDLWLDGSRGLLTLCTVYWYTETLALLNQSDPIIY